MITNHKFLFKTLFIFFSLLILPFPLNVIPKLSIINTALMDLYGNIIPWIGKNILMLEKDMLVSSNGSGDKTFDYVLLLFFSALSVIISLIWHFFEKKHKTHEKLNYWFLVSLRYFLGSIMISYGMVKIIQLQFVEPSFGQLIQSYGESSPMGLAWIFLGFSKGYNIFIGLGEVIGGVLLFHRRTKLLGCLIIIVVTANIVAINFFYDVPVKLFSSTLLTMAIIIMLPDMKRLMHVIVLNLPTKAIDYKEPFASKKWVIGKTVLKWGFVLYVLYINIDQTLEGYKKYGNEAPKPKLYGLYETTNFIKNNEIIPPLLTDQDRWKYLIIEHVGMACIYKMDMSKEWYKSTVSVLDNKLILSSYKDTTDVHSFNYLETDSTLSLNGIFKNDSIYFQSKRKNKKDFLLMNRGFHFINEYPLNK